MDKENEEITAFLVQSLGREPLRETVVSALELRGRNDDYVIDALLLKLADPNPRFRRRVQSALERLGVNSVGVTERLRLLQSMEGPRNQKDEYHEALELYRMDRK